MKTALKGDLVGCFSQIEELRQQAHEEIQEYQKLLHQAQGTLQKLAEVASKTSVHMGEAADLEVTVPKRRGRKPGTKMKGRRGRPPKASTVVKAGAKRRGRPPKAASATAAVKANGKKLGRPKKNGSAGENGDVSLKRAIWDVLERDSAANKRFIPDYPADAKGLKVAEIKEVIEKEGKWTTKSKSFAAQIQNAVYRLCDEKKAKRNDEDRRYYIVKGAQYDG